MAVLQALFMVGSLLSSAFASTLDPRQALNFPPVVCYPSKVGNAAGLASDIGLSTPSSGTFCCPGEFITPSGQIYGSQQLVNVAGYFCCVGGSSENPVCKATIQLSDPSYVPKYNTARLNPASVGSSTTIHPTTTVTFGSDAETASTTASESGKSTSSSSTSGSSTTSEDGSTSGSASSSASSAPTSGASSSGASTTPTPAGSGTSSGSSTSSTSSSSSASKGSAAKVTGIPMAGSVIAVGGLLVAAF
ncbi:hypothetical protein K461DRAFT_274492 [Myriangium duriaei CBS 260.36]|uniref:Uncharacterized protein n=1 Tax=Myriangium duriaei CBS 260.36 TaxID=1168546 RepID=A0A9P4JFW2_9PEZI|nr:hypothetical protein K461DRAFT_274492 [Myriangium duriaei CBS 260.36]